MTSESADMMLIIKNPCVFPQTHVHLVSFLKLQGHPISCSLIAITCSMVVRHYHLLAILIQPKSHGFSGLIMTIETEVVDAFYWCSEDTWEHRNDLVI